LRTYSFPLEKTNKITEFTSEDIYTYDKDLLVAGNFGGTGGGTQYVMRYSIEKLIEMGWLIII
jgi:hypothetical protein